MDKIRQAIELARSGVIRNPAPGGGLIDGADITPMLDSRIQQVELVPARLDAQQVGISSNYFEVTGVLRLDPARARAALASLGPTPEGAAAAVMAEDDNPCQPRSMTLMAGPIDCRVNPTKVNELATGKPIDWFERNLISRVPMRYPGATRRVYPGFLQLTAFMSMNAERHIKAQVDLYRALARGDQAQAGTIKTFYDEYFAVLDMTAEFYLETVERVFQQFLLARGELEWKGRRVNPKAIRRTALFTVEGERDDICAIGQTVAAHDLCPSLRPYRKKHYMQAGVGHYGVFAGKRWAGQIYPLVRNTILANE